MRLRLRPIGRSLGGAFKVVALQRTALLFVVWLSSHASPGRRFLPLDFSPDSRLLGMLMRWDAGFYWRIARDGYDHKPDAFDHRDTNFWPVFPWLWRLVHVVIPSWPISGFLLNLLLLTVAVAAISDIAKRLLPTRAARLVPLLFLAHPFAFYYSSYYTEAAFVCFSALAMCFALRQNWALASLAAGIAGGTRMVGIAAGVAVACAYVEGIGFNLRRIDRRVLWLPLAGLGTATYCGYLAWKFHDPLAFTAGLNARDWGADVTWLRFGQVVLAMLDVKQWPLHWKPGSDAAHLLFLIASIVIALAGLPKMRVPLAVFSMLTLLLSCRYWTNAGRYCAPIFPVTFVLARWLAPRPLWLVFFVTLGLAGSAVIGWLFIHGFWVS